MYRDLPREYPIAKILRQLDQNNLLPAIIFRSSRKQCDQDITHLVKKNYLKLDDHESNQIKSRIEELVKQYSWDLDLITKHEQYAPLVYYGVGAHHAGQLLAWRLLLEELMCSSLLRLLIATGTVAAGVDFPARTVVVTAHSKRGHDGFNVLAPSELQQMSGRAGRRGKDAVGFCLVAPNPYSDARVIAEINKMPPEPLKSAYFASPSTILNLLKYRSTEDLKFIVSNSLGGFIDKQDAKKIIAQAKEEKNKLDSKVKSDEHPAEIKKTEKRIRRLNRKAEELVDKKKNELESTLLTLRQLEHLNESGDLTEKGLWSAELCTNLVLELAEFIENHYLSEINVHKLIAKVASISGDHYRSYLQIKQSILSKAEKEELQASVDKVAEHYSSENSEREIKVMDDAAATVETWVSAHSWNEFSALLKLSGVAEGDASRLITQTADHLQQITRIDKTHYELANLAREARSLLLRPPLSE